jgi:hypothetical protein
MRLPKNLDRLAHHSAFSTIAKPILRPILVPCKLLPFWLTGLGRISRVCYV